MVSVLAKANAEVYQAKTAGLEASQESQHLRQSEEAQSNVRQEWRGRQIDLLQRIESRPQEEALEDGNPEPREAVVRYGRLTKSYVFSTTNGGGVCLRCILRLQKLNKRRYPL